MTAQEISLTYRRTISTLRIRLEEKRAAVGEYRRQSAAHRKVGYATFADFLDSVCIPSLDDLAARLNAEIASTDESYREACALLAELSDLNGEGASQ